MTKRRRVSIVIGLALGLVVLSSGYLLIPSYRAWASYDARDAKGQRKVLWNQELAGRVLPNQGLDFGTFQSKAAHGLVGFFFRLPPDYQTNTSKRYPVVYWLHRRDDPVYYNPIRWRLEQAAKAGQPCEVILIAFNCPTLVQSWADSRDGAVPIEKVVVKELVSHVDATFRTIPTRQARAIEGSYGAGAGAAYLGFKHPDTFGAVSIFAGEALPLKSLTSRYDQAHSPWTVVRENADKIRGRTFIRVAGHEKETEKESSENFHKLLEELGITHEWLRIPGPAGDLCRQWPGDILDFYRKAFAGAEQAAKS